MLQKKRKFKLITAVALLAATLGSCTSESSSEPDATTNSSQPQDITIALIEVGPDAFSSAQTDAFIKEATDKGYKYKTFNAQNSPTRMVSDIKQAISLEVDGIVIQAADSLSAVPPIQAANEAGICTAAVTVPIGEDDSVVFPGMKAFVGWNGTEGGRYQGMGLAEMIGGKGGVVIIQGSLANGAAAARQAGAEAVWKEDYPDIEVLQTVQTQFDNTNVVSDMKDMIAKFGPKISGVLVITDPMAVAAAKVIVDSNLQDQIAVMGFAGQKEFVDLIASGDINGATIPEAPGSEVIAAMDQIVACVGGDKDPVYVSQTDLPTIAKLKDTNYVLNKDSASLFEPQW